MEEDASLAELPKPQTLAKRYKVLLISLSLVLTLFGALILSLILYTWDRGQIANGIILEIPLGELTFEEAQGELEHLKDELNQRQVQFVSAEKTFPITLEELGLDYTYDEALQVAYLIGREGNLLDKAKSKRRASWGITFKPEYQWNDLILAEALAKHLAPLNIPAEDAYFSIAPDNSLQINSEKSGRQVDIDSLVADVKKQTRYEAGEIPISFTPVSAALTKLDLETVKSSDLFSDYTTYFDPNQRERSQNIKLAAKAIDGVLLKPGEVFSFNDTVGPRTLAAGYKVAIVIEGKKFVPGLGGGVCQVSSTLYNSVRLASPTLSIVERSRHSLPITYVPPGLDATVAYPTLDFKFRNDSEDYVLIRSLVRNNAVAFSIYGK